ncbi:head-tail connector protein [Mongoliimonas terrestris]|uniref:head-tail connector protein n=1 Tax=Mongoliimonas terrestris TaxID=1709001 RepID=UPI000949816D|nr:hypothetical protein [Mongoliimonas terrestris]
MTVTVITPPTDLVVSIEEMRRHLNETSDEFDPLLEEYILAASGLLAGPDGLLGRSLALQTLEVEAEGFCPGRIRVPCPPVVTVLSVKYDDASGIEQTLPSSAYRVVRSDDGHTYLSSSWGTSWPATRWGPGGVRIRYEAGYAPGAVPQPIKQAVRLMVADMFAYRESRIGAAAATAVPHDVEGLVANFRIWSL